MDFQIPFAAVIWAPRVSSERWADASKPVMVYWVNNKPSGSTYSQYTGPFEKPELFIRVVNIHFRSWCCAGVMISTAMINATPATCHQTDI